MGPPPAAPAAGAAGVPGAGARGIPGTQPTAPAGQAMPGAMGPGPQGGQRSFTPMTLANYNVRDLWEHKDLVLKETSMYVDMLPHSVKVYRFVRK